MSDSEEESPQLSSHALAALEEFYAEQKTQNEVKEDWQLSQFWYSKETAKMLANEVTNSIENDGSIACISCPTLFSELWDRQSTIATVLLEFDRRFEEKYGENFVFFDYNHPLDVPKNLEHKFDFVVLDPPFLSEDCLCKTAQTVKLISNPKAKVILCTGEVMENLAERLLYLKRCEFRPKHENNLANEFCCFANYETRFL